MVNDAEIKHFYLGHPGKVTVVEQDLPQELAGFKGDIDAYWVGFKAKNPKATDAPKFRLSYLEYHPDDSNLTLGISRGISWRDVVYTDNLGRERKLPQRLDDLYDINGNLLTTRVPYANVLATGGLVVLDPSNSSDLSDPDCTALFGVRSMKVFAAPGAFNFLVDGYVDDLGVERQKVDGNVLINNFLKEVDEEAYVNKSEIRDVHHLAFVQVGVRGCETVLLARSNLSYKDWKARWVAHKGQEETSRVFALQAGSIADLLSDDTRARISGQIGRPVSFTTTLEMALQRFRDDHLLDRYFRRT